MKRHITIFVIAALLFCIIASMDWKSHLLRGEYAKATPILESQLRDSPGSIELLLNLAICHYKENHYQDCIDHAKRVLVLEHGRPVMRFQQTPAAQAFALLSQSYYVLGKIDAARNAGRQCLSIKDQVAMPAPADWKLPTCSPQEFASGKQNVIAFSLWGDEPRYLRGAVHNLLLAKQFYPDWKLRFYVDSSLPSEMVALIGELGGDVLLQPDNQPLRQKLAWRFQVANDPSVGRFLVRDSDSVFSDREIAAVNQWIESDRWFHVMRDWWTHNDLILAGMWGGVAGVLPDLSAMLDAYKIPTVETNNIDQLFLGDRIWGYVRQSCLVHDSCFGEQPMPGEPTQRRHVGADEFTLSHSEQAAFLADLIGRYKFLKSNQEWEA